jgi:hypothetical protein
MEWRQDIKMVDFEDLVPKEPREPTELVFGGLSFLVQASTPRTGGHCRGHNPQAAEAAPPTLLATR